MTKNNLSEIKVKTIRIGRQRWKYCSK